MKRRLKIIFGSIILSLSLSSSIVSAEAIGQTNVNNNIFDVNKISSSNDESPYWNPYWSTRYDTNTSKVLGGVKGETRYRFLVTDENKGDDYEIYLDKFGYFSGLWEPIKSTTIKSTSGDGISVSWTWSDLDKDTTYNVRVKGKAKGKIEVFKYK